MPKTPINKDAEKITVDKAALLAAFDGTDYFICEGCDEICNGADDNNTANGSYELSVEFEKKQCTECNYDRMILWLDENGTTKDWNLFQGA